MSLNARLVTCVAVGFAAALALVTVARAVDDPPFVGKWAVEGSKACTPQGGDTDLLLTVTTKKLSSYASTCTVLSFLATTTSRSPLAALSIAMCRT